MKEGGGPRKEKDEGGRGKEEEGRREGGRSSPFSEIRENMDRFLQAHQFLFSPVVLVPPFDVTDRYASGGGEGGDESKLEIRYFFIFFLTDSGTSEKSMALPSRATLSGFT
jgi:hypothetical protein